LQEKSAIVPETLRHLDVQSDYSICHDSLSIFQQPWWLELAKGDSQFRELSVRRYGTVVGCLSFIVVADKLGNKLGLPPIWSHLGGPVVSQALAPKDRAEVMRQLIMQLPGNTSFKFVCSPADENAELARSEFERAGFVRTTETTYLEYPADLGILERLTGESRRQISSSAKTLEVFDIEADEFIAFYDANLKAAEKRSYATLEGAHNLIVRGKSSEPARTRVIAARRREPGAPLDAAIACAWDSKRYYLWLITYRAASNDAPKPHPHAVKLLILLGTEDARSRGLIFDADGAATRGSETLYRDRLKFPHSELRDVYTRDTRWHTLYKKFRAALRGREDASNQLR
jgi:hypothetical protein